MRTGSRSIRRRERGFTLIELLVVIAIIGILAATAVGQYQRNIQKAKEAALKQDLHTMRVLINNYFADKGKYPADLQALVEDRYLQEIPRDPFTGSNDTWVTEPAAVGDEDISTEPGIANVKSGAEGSSVDGVPYSEF